MKKFICVALILLFLFGMPKFEGFKKQNYLELINNATTFEEILLLDETVNVESIDEENKKILSNKIFDYIFKWFEKNEVVNYYYFESDVSLIRDSNISSHYTTKDLFFIFGNDNNIHIIPGEQIINFIDETGNNQIAEMPNFNDYEYELSIAEIRDNTLVVTLKNKMQDLYIKMIHDGSNEYITLSGKVVGLEGVPLTMKYYSNVNMAVEAAERYVEEEWEKLEKEQEENKEQEEYYSIPRIGMTATEVRNSSWGSPDKINKDTYSWGTTEQWVYNKKGYIYFRNGVVTSISER